MSVLIVYHLWISCLCTCDRYPACCTVFPFFVYSLLYVFVVALFFVEAAVLIYATLYNFKSWLQIPFITNCLHLVQSESCVTNVFSLHLFFRCCPADTILRLILIKITCTPSSLGAFFLQALILMFAQSYKENWVGKKGNNWFKLS